MHVISIPKSSGTIADDILSPNVSLAPKRVLCMEGGPRKRFCSGHGHYDILQTPHGTLEVLKTEHSPDGNLKMKLISHPIPSASGVASNVKGKTKHAVPKPPPTATVTSSNGLHPKLEGRKRDISICSDKDGFDYVANQPDIDLADINPSIMQMMGSSNQDDKVNGNNVGVGNDNGAQSSSVMETSQSHSASSQVVNMIAKEFAEGVNLAQQQQQTLVNNRQQQQQLQQQALQRVLNLASQAVNDNKKRNLLQNAIAQGHTQGQAMDALAAILANQQKVKQQQQQQQQQQPAKGKTTTTTTTTAAAATTTTTVAAAAAATTAAGKLEFPVAAERWVEPAGDE